MGIVKGEMSSDIRWKQRFENLLKAFKLLQEAVERDGLSRLEEEGMVQRFEYTFELAWKTLKDLLMSRGVDATFPRDVIKEAFQSGLVTDGDTWIEMLDRRNQLSYTYNETTFTQAIENVRTRYYPALATLVETLRRIE